MKKLPHNDLLSPLKNIIIDDVNEGCNTILNDTVNPWIFFFSKKGVNIKTADGRPISMSGSAMEFRGSPMDVFWFGFIDGHIKKKSKKLIELTRLKAIERKVSVKDALQDCLICLHDMISKIFVKMAEIDQILRGKGFPDSVKKVDTKSFVEKNYSNVKPLIDAEIECIHQAEQKQENIKSVLSEYSFTLTGDYWKLKFKNEETTIRNFERLRYIIHLLDNPNKIFNLIELVQLVKGNQIKYDPNYTKMSKEQIEKEGLRIVTSSTNEVLGKDKKKYEDIAYIVWEKFLKAKQDGDIEAIEKAQGKWDTLKKSYSDQGIIISIKDEFLKFSYKSRLDSNAEKARANVTKHINNAIKDLKEKKMASFSKYVEKYIKTGNQCSYNPPEESEINWVIKWNQ